MRCVVITDYANNIDFIACFDFCQCGHLINNGLVIALGQRGVVARGGTQNGAFDFHAGALQGIGTAFENLGDGLYNKGQSVARRKDVELVAVAAIDVAQFGQAVVVGAFAVGLHHVAKRQLRGDSIVVEEKTNASRGVLDVDVAPIDEGHDALH